MAICNQQFYLEDIDTEEYITGATVEVGGVECEHEYPSIERYQKDDLVEGSWYNVVASKTGYICPDDICKDTFEACGDAIVLKLEAKEDTNASCDDKEAEPDGLVSLSGYLGDAAGYPLPLRELLFYIDGECQCSDFTGAAGFASCYCTAPSSAGTYTITVEFEETDNYNSDTGTCTLIVTSPTPTPSHLFGIVLYWDIRVHTLHHLLLRLLL